MLCTTRTPDMFSLSAPLTIEIVRLTSTKPRRAKGCQTITIRTKTGTNAIEIRPSSRLIVTTTATIRVRLSRSPTVMTAMERNS